MEPAIIDEGHIPHGSAYSSLLAKSSTFKAELISYITSHFSDEALSTTREYDYSITLYSPALTSVIKVSGGIKVELPANQHGEADF